MAAGTEAWAMNPTPYLKAEADGESAWRNRHQLPLTQAAAVDALLQGGAGAYGTNHPLFAGGAPSLHRRSSVRLVPRVRG